MAPGLKEKFALVVWTLAPLMFGIFVGQCRYEGRITHLEIELNKAKDTIIRLRTISLSASRLAESLTATTGLREKIQTAMREMRIAAEESQEKKEVVAPALKISGGFAKRAWNTERMIIQLRYENQQAALKDPPAKDTAENLSKQLAIIDNARKEQECHFVVEVSPTRWDPTVVDLREEDKLGDFVADGTLIKACLKESRVGHPATKGQLKKLRAVIRKHLLNEPVWRGHSKELEEMKTVVTALRGGKV